MARCKYCGDSAGFLRRSHPGCEQNFEIGERQIAMEVAAAASASGEIDGLPSRVAMVAREARVSERRMRELVIVGWITAVEKSLVDGALDEEEKQRLVRLQDKFGLTHAELAATANYSRWYAKSLLARTRSPAADAAGY